MRSRFECDIMLEHTDAQHNTTQHKHPTSSEFALNTICTSFFSPSVFADASTFKFPLAASMRFMMGKMMVVLAILCTHLLICAHPQARSLLCRLLCSFLSVNIHRMALEHSISKCFSTKSNEYKTK